MKNKFALSHTVLYAKGWYKKSGDVIEDLKKILRLDDYTPFSDSDVYSILLSNIEEFECTKFSLFNVLQGIAPRRCIMNGYDFKEGEYSSEMAFIYYVLSTLRFLDRDLWTPVTPKYTKYPKASHITVRGVYECFVEKKLV